MPSGTDYAARDTVNSCDGQDAERQPLLTSAQLRRVPGSVPWTTYCIAFAEFAERASYFGVGATISNFVQRPLPEGGSGTGAPPRGSETKPGALGLGLPVASTVGVIFTMLSYVMPLLGGILSDLKWGKFKTLVVGTVIGAISHILSVYAALPSVIREGASLAPFLSGVMLLGISAGLISSTVAPLMAEQHPHQDDYKKVLPSGEVVIVDREATIQRIMSTQFMSINVGAFIALGSTFAERYVGFWLAFLLPGAVFCLVPPILYLVQPYLLKQPETGTSAPAELADLAKHAARRLRRSDETESNEDLDRIFLLGQILLFFIIYNIGDTCLQALEINLAGSMTTKGLPNDFMIIFNPMAIVICVPLLDNIMYPFLSARQIPFGPVRRIVTGFLILAASMCWCAILQARVYATSPCGNRASDCHVGTGVSPISAWWFIPAPMLSGLSEILASISAVELAYLLAPPSLRSTSQALFLSIEAISALLVLPFAPIMRDPFLVCPFSITAVCTVVAAYFIWRRFKHLDSDEQ